MADLDITVNLQDVEKLKEILGNLAPLYGKTVARIDRENKQLERSTKASMQVMITALNEVVGVKAQNDLAKWGAAQRQRISLMEKSEKLAERQAVAEAKVTAELVRQRSAAENLERANAQRFQNQIGGNLGLGAQGISAGASSAAFEGDIERLRQKFDGVYRAATIYESALNEINQAHLYGITSIKQHEAAVESLNAEYQAFQNGTSSAFNRFNTNATIARQRVNEYGVVTQQVGYQVGDFLVQVQSGTNWMVAFGQQATQLVGVLPLMSSAIGVSASTLTLWATGLGIAIPLVTALGAMWMRSSASGESAAKVVDLYTEAINAANSEVDALNKKLLEMRYPDLSDAQRLLKDQLDEAKQKAEDLRKEIEALDQGPNFRGKSIGLSQLNDALNVAVGKANDLEKHYAEVSKKQAELADGASELARFEERRRQTAEAILMPLRQAKEGQERLITLTKSLAEVDITGPWDALIARIGDAIAKTGEYKSSVGGGRGLGPQGPALDPYGFRSQLESDKQSSSTGSSGGGGGGGGNSRLDTLIQELQTEQETLDTWYKESQSALQSASDQELAILGGKYEAMVALNKEYNDKIQAIEAAAAQQRLSDTANLFGALADVASVGGKKTAKAVAVFQAIEGTINAYGAAIKALNTPGITLAGRFAAYASVLAAGLKGVAAIRSAGGIGGGGGGHSPGTSTVSNQTESAGPQTVYIDSIDPGGLYSGQMLINLFDAFYNENDKRGKVFVVGR